MRTLITIDIDPMQVPEIAARQQAVRQYAERYIMHGMDHETLHDYCAQVGLDWQDESMELEVKREIRKLWRKQRQKTTGSER